MLLDALAPYYPKGQRGRPPIVPDFLPAHFGDRDDPPDVELNGDVDKDRGKNGEGEIRQEFFGEDCGLREKGRPDGRCRQDEYGAENDGDARFPAHGVLLTVYGLC